MNFHKAKYETPFSKYNALQSALSAYVKEKQLRTGTSRKKGSKIIYEGYTFRELMKLLWTDVVDKSLTAEDINERFEQIITEQLQLPLFCEWWQLEDIGFSQIERTHPAIVDARFVAGYEYYYKGVADIFLTDIWADWMTDFNTYGFDTISQDQSGVGARELNSDNLPKWIFQFLKDVKGKIWYYALLIDIDDFEQGFTVFQYLRNQDALEGMQPVYVPYGKSPDAEPVIEIEPVDEPKIKKLPKKLPKKGGKKLAVELKIEQERVKVEQEKTKQLASLSDLLTKGLITPEVFASLADKLLSK